MHPGIQKKAQAAVDKVVGKDRIPEVADKESLPYITAIMKEIFRWHNILPLSKLLYDAVDVTRLTFYPQCLIASPRTTSIEATMYLLGLQCWSMFGK